MASNDLNLCQFIGRLGKDPETRYMPGGDAVTIFSLAVGRGVLPEPDPPHRNFTFRATDVATILAIYREICGGELEVSPQVAALRTKITVEPDHDLKPPEALRLIEAALHKQAGILIMRQASNRFTATLSQ